MFNISSGFRKKFRVVLHYNQFTLNDTFLILIVGKKLNPPLRIPNCTTVVPSDNILKTTNNYKNNNILLKLTMFQKHLCKVYNKNLD